MAPEDWAELPGAELIRAGLEDLVRGRESAETFLVAIGASRLRAAGLTIPPLAPSDHQPFEHRLYALLNEMHPAEAYPRYNGLIRRLVSFERALEHAVARQSADSRE